jgi:predicted small lipoprotein YifL
MNDRRRRVQLVVAFAFLLAASGCGQTGPLALPGSNPAPNQSPAAPTAEDEDEDEAQQ